MSSIILVRKKDGTIMFYVIDHISSEERWENQVLCPRSYYLGKKMEQSGFISTILLVWEKDLTIKVYFHWCICSKER